MKIEVGDHARVMVDDVWNSVEVIEDRGNIGPKNKQVVVVALIINKEISFEVPVMRLRGVEKLKIA